MRTVLFLFFGLMIALPAFAQQADFEAFIKSFPQEKLPYLCKTSPAYKKQKPISKKEASAFLGGFKNTDGHTVSHYEMLITPFKSSKTEAGKGAMSKTKGYKIAFLQQTKAYIVVLARVAFIQKGFDNIEGEQFLLHTFKIDGTPIHTLPIAQKVQFDLHSNEVHGKVEANGYIWVRVQTHTVSGTEERIEHYQIQADGTIKELKE